VSSPALNGRSGYVTRQRPVVHGCARSRVQVAVAFLRGESVAVHQLVTLVANRRGLAPCSHSLSRECDCGRWGTGVGEALLHDAPFSPTSLPSKNRQRATAPATQMRHAHGRFRSSLFRRENGKPFPHVACEADSALRRAASAALRRPLQRKTHARLSAWPLWTRPRTVVRSPRDLASCAG
jgi:hypothetical protein